MFAELLNGLLFLHNKRAGVNVNDEHERLRQPHLRIGVIPAGNPSLKLSALVCQATPCYGISLEVNTNM